MKYRTIDFIASSISAAVFGWMECRVATEQLSSLKGWKVVKQSLTDMSVKCCVDTETRALWGK